MSLSQALFTYCELSIGKVQTSPNKLEPSREIEKSLSYGEFKANNRKKGNKKMGGEGMQVSCTLYSSRKGQ